MDGAARTGTRDACSRLYREHALRVQRVPRARFSMVKFFRGGGQHRRRGQIWAFVLFVWDLRGSSGPSLRSAWDEPG